MAAVTMRTGADHWLPPGYTDALWPRAGRLLTSRWVGLHQCDPRQFALLGYPTVVESVEHILQDCPRGLLTQSHALVEGPQGKPSSWAQADRRLRRGVAIKLA
jgi:hypothetical protein